MFESEINISHVKNSGDYSIDKFEINGMKILGFGAQGTICECKHPDYDFPLCVKIIKLGSSQRLQHSREPEIIQQIKELKHKNIIKIVHIAQTIDNCYIFMERCKYDLNEFIKNYEAQPIPASLLNDIIKQVVNGYLSLQEKEIVHRDLKTANLLIGLDGNIKISDFGLGKILGNPQNMQQQSTVCTTYYASPQILKDGIYSGKSDVFSLGVVIYKAAYKKHPYIENPGCLLSEWMRIYEQLRANKNYVLQLPECPGTESEKQELYWFLKSSLALEEEDRISWIDLFIKYCDDYVPREDPKNSVSDEQIYVTMAEKELQHHFLVTSPDFKQLFLNKSQSAQTILDTTPTANGMKASDQQNSKKRLIIDNSQSLFQDNQFNNENFIETQKGFRQFDERILKKLLDVLLAKSEFAQKVILNLRKNITNFNDLFKLDYYLLSYKYQILLICHELAHNKPHGQFLKQIQLSLPIKEILKNENSQLLKKQILQSFSVIEKEYKVANEYMKKLIKLPKEQTHPDYIFYWRKAQLEINEWLKRQVKSIFENQNLWVFVCQLIKFSQLEQEMPNNKFEEISVSQISYIDENDELYENYYNSINNG